MLWIAWSIIADSWLFFSCSVSLFSLWIWEMSLSTQIYHPEEVRMPEVMPALNLIWQLVRLRAVQFMVSRKVSTAGTGYSKQEIEHKFTFSLIASEEHPTKLNFTTLVLESWQSSDFSLGVSDFTKSNLTVLFWLTVSWGDLIMSISYIESVGKENARKEVELHKRNSHLSNIDACLST